MTGDLQQRLLAGFAGAFGGIPDATIRAPGRVNLIGEHTDYNDGFVLPAAIGVETRVAFRRRADHRVHAIACDFADQRDAFAIADTIEHHPHGGWRDYVRGMVATVAAAGYPLTGVDIAIAGNMPREAGLSSSAALEVAIGHVMLAAAGIEAEQIRIAQLAQAAECDFVGMRCGIMDQLASAACAPGAALLVDCRSLALRSVPIPADVAIMIVHSGVVRGLVDGHYNRRRAECEEAAAALNIAALRDADLAMLAAGTMSADARARAHHIVTENARTLAAADALAANDLTTMGRLMVESHASMRDDFAITVPPVDRLAALMTDAIGGEGGARMTGGGFGGAVVGLMRVAAVDRVAAAVRAGYATPDGGEPLIMIERAAAGAGRVEPA